MKFKFWIVITLLLVAVVIWVIFMRTDENSDQAIPDQVSFNFNIRPVLSDKCFKCHGPDANKREAGLRLDIRDSALAPLREAKGAFAIIPFKPDESEVFKRISSTDSSYQMPLPSAHLGPLSKYEIALFKKWISQGAKYETLWSLVKPVKAPLPKIKNKKLARNEIDYFILAKQEDKGLKPNGEADKERLLKRLSLDLTGLPPSEKMMERFMANTGVNAYEEMADDILKDPAYGEKMAIHWLDIARYSDSYGYQDDNIRTQWPWRDWVIHAFNENLPYDKFITWQIAGDMLPNASKEEILATAFFRNHKYTEEGGVIPEEYRIEYILDKTKTFSKGILGLTAECAQCHDHKYDPISQKDYFQLFAFFNSTKEVGYEGDVGVSKPAKNPILNIDDADVKNILSFINKKDTGSMMVSVMGEMDTIRKTYILNRGVYNEPTTQVFPSALKAVMPFDTINSPRNRLGLAAWTVNKNNPLTARVLVNHIWQEIFGRGLVKSAGDFGMQGTLPSHPELLDWLAVDFMEHGWDIKRLMKQIVMSGTYRESSRINENNYKKDPENIYLARAPRLRVKAEIVRDIVLSSSGLLVRTIGGPSVKPYQPKGLWEMASSGRGELATYKQDRGDALYRRGMYTFIKLTVPPASMILFDASNRDQCEVTRSQTNTPLQALMMMDDPTVLEASRVLAQKLMENNLSTDERIKKAFRRIICRTTGDNEFLILKSYYDGQLNDFRQKRLDAALTLKVGEYPQDKKPEANATAALMKVISMIYNMEETLSKT
ncbi:MAG: PSD1 and planctomycete cytochrome C domain-containing protein [Ginsengibacter sp.]